MIIVKRIATAWAAFSSMNEWEHAITMLYLGPCILASNAKPCEVNWRIILSCLALGTTYHGGQKLRQEFSDRVAS
jgi:hypothetical protein